MPPSIAYSPLARRSSASARFVFGSPPPPRQPPGQAMTSTATYLSRHASSRSSSTAAAMPLTTATVPTFSTCVSLIALLVPRIPLSSSGSSGRPSVCTAVRKAASMTPPLAPKRLAAPVDSPSGSSKTPSFGREANCTWRERSIRASSRVVMTASMCPSLPGRSASSFLAVHGITDTTNGFAPASSRVRNGPNLVSAPCICCGLLVVLRCGRRSGRDFSR
mmetsp:Transcript_12956/g.24777  ORF Transcript_12956/g.24777 Transcript_12956/m.24777 type:complete len:220 (+) Transcript_12956:752-1411(+)